MNTTEYVVDESQAPLDQENQVLRWFQDLKTVNPKKLVRLAKQIENTVPDFIRRSIVDNVLCARHPQKFLAEAFREMNDLPIIMEGLMADGNHGMIMYGNNIYGVEVKANQRWLKQGDRWNLEQEEEIMDSIVDEWMTKNKIRVFLGRIVLFKEFGFSGMARKITQQMTPEFFESLQADGVKVKQVEAICKDIEKQAVGAKHALLANGGKRG